MGSAKNWLGSEGKILQIVGKENAISLYNPVVLKLKTGNKYSFNKKCKGRKRYPYNSITNGYDWRLREVGGRVVGRGRGRGGRLSRSFMHNLGSRDIYTSHQLF